MAYVSSNAVTIDDSGLREGMGRLAAAFPYAVADAVNHLQHSTRKRERDEILRVFDRPTPMVQNGLRVAKRATKTDPSGAIWFKDVFGKRGDAIENTLRPHIHGESSGRRNVKSTEKRLRDVGILHVGEWLVGVSSAQNRYGNVPGAEHQRMLSYFRAYREAGVKDANRRTGASSSRAGWRYFINRAGSHIGIYRVRGKRGKPKLIWLIVPSAPTYRSRFDFYGVAKSHADREGPRIGRQAMEKAIRRARK